MPTEKNHKEALLKLIQEAIEQDSSLRGEFKVGDKFRFIRDRLNALQKNMEENLAASIERQEKQTQSLSADEDLVYIYLYNAQGQVLQSWQKMLNPGVFYEYSINRPIYRNKSDIEGYIRSKPNRQQHGYLTIAVKKINILSPTEATLAQDGMGNPLVKVKEGALKATRMLAFTNNGIDYVVDEAGQLIKKTADNLSSS